MPAARDMVNLGAHHTPRRACFAPGSRIWLAFPNTACSGVALDLAYDGCGLTPSPLASVSENGRLSGHEPADVVPQNPADSRGSRGPESTGICETPAGCADATRSWPGEWWLRERSPGLWARNSAAGGLPIWLVVAGPRSDDALEQRAPARSIARRYNTRRESTMALAAGTRLRPYEILGPVGPLGTAADLRCTGVLEERDGKWVIVQMHASLAADEVREVVLEDRK